MIKLPNIILKEKQVSILIKLSDKSQHWYISSISKATDTTYVHACNFINVCEKLGLVKSEKHGKIKNIQLTEKGFRVAGLILNINSIIHETDKKETTLTSQTQSDTQNK